MYNNLKNKLLFGSEDVWRKVFLCKKSVVFKAREKFIHHRSSIIPKTFLYDEVSIYTGKKWTKRYVNRWMIGYKFGEFTWNKKIALYKAKQLRKKK
jgi:ribosomal protein S19